MRLFLIVILISIFLAPFSVLAQEGTIIADYQEMIRDKKAETLELKGNVNIVFKQQHLLCDRAIIYEKTKILVAEGNVVLQNGRTTLRGDKIEFNYDTNLGKLYGGVVTSGQVLLEADVIEKTGEDEYVADDAYYTSCTTCPASWSFSSSSVKAEMGGYAYISRPWLHLLQIPVLPLPYLVVPLNSERETGLLVPKPFSNPEGGFAVEVPFFWAIDRSHDATFSLINYEKRGVQPTANYRYVISPTSSGELNTAFLRDRTVSQDQFKNRWFVEYGHQYDLPENYTQRTKISIASDRRYAFDFFQQFLHNGDPALENSVSLSKSFDNSLLTLEASYYQSQIEEGRTFRDDNSLHRLPEINYELNDIKISDDLNMFFSLDAQYLNVTRGGLAFEHGRSGTECTTFKLDNEVNDGKTLELDPSGNPIPVKSDVCFPTALSSGDFVYGNPLGQGAASEQAYGDLIRTGQRFDIMPRIHAPFWIGNVLDVDPSLAVRFTQYSLGVASDNSQGYESAPSRLYSQLGLDIKSDLNRVYSWSEETRIKHSILPHIKLRYIPEVWQTEHNFFGKNESQRFFREMQPIDDSDSDWRSSGRGIQFDHNDRIVGRQFVDLGISNKIISRDLNQLDALGSKYVRSFYFRVSQAMDLYELRKGSDARAWQSLDTLTQFDFGPISQSITTSFFPYHNRTHWSTRTRYRFGAGNHFQLGYRKNYTILETPPVLESSKREFLDLGLGLNLPYIYIFGSTSIDLFTSREEDLEAFQAWRVALQFTPPGSCWMINAELLKTIGNPDIQPSINMEFQFGQ